MGTVAAPAAVVLSVTTASEMLASTKSASNRATFGDVVCTGANGPWYPCTPVAPCVPAAPVAVKVTGHGFVALHSKGKSRCL